MTKINLHLEEPFLLKIQSISDDRGLLIPMTDDIDPQLIKRGYYVEDYGRGVIRGLHYHKKEFKIFTVPCGAGKFITLKLPEAMADKNDPDEIREYLQKNPGLIKSFVFSSRHHCVLIIPPLYANGWVSLEDHTILFALSNLIYEEARDDDIRIDPLIIGENYWKAIPR